MLKNMIKLLGAS